MRSQIKALRYGRRVVIADVAADTAYVPYNVTSIPYHILDTDTTRR